VLPYVRKTKSVEAALPWLYLKGISTGEMGEALKVLVGDDAKGLSASIVRESTMSWREVLLNLKHRGMNAPQLAIGDGALGFWSAIDEIYPKTRHQRCWVHKTANILNKQPKSLQAKAKSSIQEIWLSDTKKNANKAFDLFSKHIRTNIQRRLFSYKKIEKSYWLFMIFQLSIGKV
jgi:putative transposase